MKPDDLPFQILKLIKGNPLSSRQLARELHIDLSVGGKKLNRLIESLDDLRKAGLVEIAVDRKSRLPEGVVGPNTYRYYRLDEEQRLEQKGVLSKECLITVRSINPERGF